MSSIHNHEMWSQLRHKVMLEWLLVRELGCGGIDGVLNIGAGGSVCRKSREDGRLFKVEFDCEVVCSVHIRMGMRSMVEVVKIGIVRSSVVVGVIRTGLEGNVDV